MERSPPNKLFLTANRLHSRIFLRRVCHNSMTLGTHHRKQPWKRCKRSQYRTYWWSCYAQWRTWWTEWSSCCFAVFREGIWISIGWEKIPNQYESVDPWDTYLIALALIECAQSCLFGCGQAYVMLSHTQSINQLIYLFYLFSLNIKFKLQNKFNGIKK